MEEIKTEKQLKIEFRNRIAARLIENRANLIYWKKIARQAKANTPTIMQALRNVQTNKNAINDDIVFLKCIDEMIKGKN